MLLVRTHVDDKALLEMQSAVRVQNIEEDSGSRLIGCKALTVLLLTLRDKRVIWRDRLREPCAKKKSLRGLSRGPGGVVYLSRVRVELPRSAA
jgi:hypothetical protein